MTNVPKTFCIAPWTHTYLSPQSERRLCCASRETPSWTRQYIDSEGSSQQEIYNPQSLKDHWNSDHMKSVRKRMLAGEKLPECQICNDNILNLHTYRQYFTETLFPHKILEALSSTDSDGFTTMNPISFDYRISNLCNFKCRMCGEQLSSSWEAEKRLMNVWDRNRDKWMLPENKKTIEKFQTEVAEHELWEAVNNNTIEEIYWVGGEPLMYQIHWDIMKKLVDTSQSKNVIVRYNTNLSKISHQDTKLYDLLPHFKKVNMCCSIDGTEQIGEWIRSGLKWDRWLEYFKRGLFLNDIYGKDAMVLDVTLTLPGMFSMKQMIDLAVELNVKSYVKISFDFDASAIMSPMCLPRDLLNDICDELIEYESVHGNQFTRVYSQTFNDMKTRPTFQDKYNNYLTGLKRGKERYQKITEFRKDILTIEDIFSTNKPVLEWWSKI